MGSIFTGRKSKNRVRSPSVDRLMSCPRVSGRIPAYTCLRLVVFPERPGP